MPGNCKESKLRCLVAWVEVVEPAPICLYLGQGSCIFRSQLPLSPANLCTQYLSSTYIPEIARNWHGGKLFGTLFAYYQNRHSGLLRGMACCELQDENRWNVTPVSRPNMSTTELERRPAQRTQNGLWWRTKSTYSYFADHAYNLHSGG